MPDTITPSDNLTSISPQTADQSIASAVAQQQSLTRQTAPITSDISSTVDKATQQSVLADQSFLAQLNQVSTNRQALNNQVNTAQSNIINATEWGPLAGFLGLFDSDYNVQKQTALIHDAANKGLALDQQVVDANQARETLKSIAMAPVAGAETKLGLIRTGSEALNQEQTGLAQGELDLAKGMPDADLQQAAMGKNPNVSAGVATRQLLENAAQRSQTQALGLQAQGLGEDERLRGLSLDQLTNIAAHPELNNTGVPIGMIQARASEMQTASLQQQNAAVALKANNLELYKANVADFINKQPSWYLSNLIEQNKDNVDASGNIHVKAPDGTDLPLPVGQLQLAITDKIPKEAAARSQANQVGTMMQVGSANVQAGNDMIDRVTALNGGEIPGLLDTKRLYSGPLSLASGDPAIKGSVADPVTFSSQGAAYRTDVENKTKAWVASLDKDSQPAANELLTTGGLSTANAVQAINPVLSDPTALAGTPFEDMGLDVSKAFKSAYSMMYGLVGHTRGGQAIDFDNLPRDYDPETYFLRAMEQPGSQGVNVRQGLQQAVLADYMTKTLYGLATNSQTTPGMKSYFSKYLAKNPDGSLSMQLDPQYAQYRHDLMGLTQRITGDYNDAVQKQQIGPPEEGNSPLATLWSAYGSTTNANNYDKMWGGQTLKSQALKKMLGPTANFMLTNRKAVTDTIRNTITNAPAKGLLAQPQSVNILPTPTSIAQKIPTPVSIGAGLAGQLYGAVFNPFYKLK